MSRGAVRRGEALLAGLLPCGHCGRKLHVAYSGENGSSGRYHCRGGHLNHGGDPCVSFGGMRIDRAVGVEVIECLQPLGVEAAISALEARQIESAEKRAQVDLALEQARYEAALARRRYDAVDPDNGRLKPNAIRWQRGPYLRSPPQSGDVCSPSAQTSSGPGTARARRRRPASGSPYPIEEIVVRVEDDVLSLVIRWAGGTAPRCACARTARVASLGYGCRRGRTRVRAGATDAGSGDCSRAQQGIVMSGRHPQIKGYFRRCTGRGCGHVFGLFVRRIESAGPDVVR